ncbi:MAG: alkaline phosphatase family protein [Jatrophihabitans sp.]|uniref:alkaline phosphatase family protein n=1 Tax=Jatrophihabitans sp. TaxID=1932789 RepID=UPI003F7D1536
MGRLSLLAILVSSVALASCSSGDLTSDAITRRIGAPKLLVIMEENHSCQDAARAMPFLSGLGRTSGGARVSCANWSSFGHGSLHAYIDLATGADQGISTDGPPGTTRGFDGPTVFDQAIHAGATAKIYAESMPSNCAPDNTALYVARHNPWPYGRNPTVRAHCHRDDVPLGTTAGGALVHDIRSGDLPDDGLIVPNLQHDAHNGSLAESDAWLRAWIPIIERGTDFETGRLTVVITWDEPDLTEPGSNPVETVILNKALTGQIIGGKTYTLFSLTRWYEDVTHSTHLASAAAAADLRTVLHL